jgi:hypothetical protein
MDRGTSVAVKCANCAAPIVDPTSQVVHGATTFCCPNCSAVMEQRTGGSDPHAPKYESSPRCSRCESPIIDDRFMEERDGLVYCCRNCAAAAMGPS